MTAPRGSGTAEATRQATAEAEPGSVAGVASFGLDGRRGTIASKHGRRDFILRRALVGADALGVLAAGVVAFLFSSARPSAADALFILPTLPVWLLLFRTYGLYERDVKRIGHSVLDDIPALFHAFVIGTLVLWIYYRLLTVPRLTYVEAIVFGIAGILLVMSFRWIAWRAVRASFGSERVLLIGTTRLIGPLARKMTAHREYGLRPVGVVQVGASPPHIDAVPVVSRLDGLDLRRTVDEHEIQRVIVAHEDVPDETLMNLIQACGAESVKVGILPQAVDVLGPSLEIDDIEGMTVLSLNPLVVSRSSRFLKRGMDLFGAGVAFVFMALILVAIMTAIKLDSRGPVFFRQDRVGRRGRRFTLLKFRTMVPDAEHKAEDLWDQSEDPNWLKLEDDPRVTRVGRLLRQTSLDELPQLLNVLRGDMSLVGPRPLIPLEDEQIVGWARIRLELPPGITGLWQVLGRTSIPFEEMIKLDCLYVTNWSMWMDLKLIIRTVPAVLLRRGVN